MTAPRPLRVRLVKRFDTQIRTNQLRLLGFLAGYLIVAAATGYLVGLYLEAQFDPGSYEARLLYGIVFPWDSRVVDGYPRPFFFNSTFRVTVVFLAAALAYCWWLTRHGGATVLRLAGARPLRELQFRNAIDEMTVASGGPPPQVSVIETPALNAFACRDRRGREVIALTRGILDTMDRDQIQAVVAHEMAHLRNGDTRLMTLFVGVARVTSFIRWIGLTGVQVIVWMIRGAAEEARSDEEPTGAPVDGDRPIPVHPVDEDAAVRAWRSFLTKRSSPALLLLSLLLVAVFAAFAFAAVAAAYVVLFGPAWKALWLFLVLPFGLLVLRQAMSRNREYQADATAVRLTRNPVGLRRALEVMYTHRAVTAIPPAVAPLLMAPLHGGSRLPLRGFEELLYDEGWLVTPATRQAILRAVRHQWFGKRVAARLSLFILAGAPVRAMIGVVRGVAGAVRTHPPLRLRIERLVAMGG